MPWGRVLPSLILALAALVAPVAPATADIGACDCADCLELMKASTLAERQLYQDRWPTAKKNIEAMATGGEIPFCDMWGTLEDEFTLLREKEIPKKQKQIFATEKDKACNPLLGGSTSPIDCSIDQEIMKINEITAPCKAVHLSILAHELVHRQDCLARQKQSAWLKNLPKGKHCWDAYKGKTTPTPAQLMAYAEAAFATELHAHQLEAQVNDLLRRRQLRLCKPDEDSIALQGDYKEAAKLLKRAETYKIKVP